MKKRTAEEFEQQADILNITHWDNHECSLCGYMTKYVFNYGDVFFDQGCHCTSSPVNLKPRTWEEVADHYNMQTNSEVQEKFKKFWGFDD